MQFDGLTITAVVVFFVVAATVIYRWLLNVCGKLCAGRQGGEQEASREGRS